MALVRWNPSGRNVALNRNFKDDWECFLEDFFGGQPRTWRNRSEEYRPAFSPRVDLIDNKTEFIVRADVPGLDKDELDITINAEVVTIKGERKAEETSEDECFYCRESSYGSFERVVTLPEKIVNDEAKANLKNGVLTLNLPKAEPTGAVKIEVN